MSKTLVASSVASGRCENNTRGFAMTFCDVVLESFGALPGSTFTVISPPMVSSCSDLTVGDGAALIGFAGVSEPRFDLRGGDRVRLEDACN